MPTTRISPGPSQAVERCRHVDISRTNAVALAAAALGRARWPWLPPDPEAERVWASLGADAAELGDDELAAASRRTRCLDRLARRWARAHPGGVLVEVGAGLSTRHARLAALDVVHVAVDEPDVAGLRRSVFTSRPGRRQIAAPLEDRSWARQITSFSRTVLTLVPDALIDLHPADTVSVLVAIAAELPTGSPVVAAFGRRARFDVTDPTARRASLTVHLGGRGRDAAPVHLPGLRWVCAPRSARGDAPSLALLATC